MESVLIRSLMRIKMSKLIKLTLVLLISENNRVLKSGKKYKTIFHKKIKIQIFRVVWISKTKCTKIKKYKSSLKQINFED